MIIYVLEYGYIWRTVYPVMIFITFLKKELFKAVILNEVIGR